MITASCRPTLWAMRTIYHRLLLKMLADPLSVVREQRIRLSSVEKASIVLRARWRARGVRGLRQGARAAAPASQVGAARSNGR
jgi:hypothetical protein